MGSHRGVVAVDGCISGLRRAFQCRTGCHWNYTSREWSPSSCPDIEPWNLQYPCADSLYVIDRRRNCRCMMAAMDLQWSTMYQTIGAGLNKASAHLRQRPCSTRIADSADFAEEHLGAACSRKRFGGFLAGCNRTIGELFRRAFGPIFWHVLPYQKGEGENKL